MNTLEEIVNRREAEGFQGAHSLIFLIKYAALANDRHLMELVTNTMESMNSLPLTPDLLAAYKELYRATGKGADAIKYLSASLPERPENMPWDYLEKYRESFRPEYLESAVKGGEYILEHFHEMFSPEDVYDIEAPSFNSRVAVLYDELARYTQDAKFIEAREHQNDFIRRLAEKYPTKVAYGLIALLADEFGETTVVCEGEVPPVLADFYAPTTAVVFRPSDKKAVYLMENGELKEIRI